MKSAHIVLVRKLNSLDSLGRKY